MIDNTYKNELPIVYDAPKPEKIIFTEDDLSKADTFAFGSIIGQITNKSSNGYALLPILESQYGIDSEECKLVNSRLKQCCKAQSAQIDKSKIGKEVKGIPSVWLLKQKIEESDPKEEKQRKEILNHCLLTKRPYFFKYLYWDAKKAYNNYLDRHDIMCSMKFQMNLQKLKSLIRKTPEQAQFLKNFYQYMPLTYSDSSMNLVCRYIEEVNFKIHDKLKVKTDDKLYELYKNPNYEYTSEQYADIICVMTKYKKYLDMQLAAKKELLEDDSVYNNIYLEIANIRRVFNKICSNPWIVTNCLVDYFYVEKPNANKGIMINAYGDYIFKNILHNTNQGISFPLPNTEGDITYLGKKYKRTEIEY